MSILSLATDIVKESWCKGAYRQTLPEGQQFCSAGALMQASSVINNVRFELADYDNDSIKILADVIVENYPQYYLDKNYHQDRTNQTFLNEAIIIRFNDDVAKSHDEIVQMFEKATAQFDELN